MICRTMSSVQTERKPSTEVARRSDGRLDLWVCTRCGYTYDGELGEPLGEREGFHPASRHGRPDGEPGHDPRG